jgi:hypothetical protein
MYPSPDAREISVLLRICRDLDVVGDVTATVDNPSELIAWASVMADAQIVAWRAKDSGHRYIQVTTERRTAPVRGRITAVLPCEQHRQFWDALGLRDLVQDGRTHLDKGSLSDAWSEMPVTPSDMESATG